MKRLWLLPTIAALVLPGQALACDMPGRSVEPAAIARQARAIIDRSTAIIDAEVVAPTGGPDSMARLRPLRVLKGPRLPVFLVATPTSCDLAFLRTGARMRVFLTGGPQRFVAAQWNNGMGFPTGLGFRRLNAALDVLLRAPRPAGFVPPGQ